MKIGILGDTFDPVHRGHLELAQNAHAQFALDKVIFVPTFRSPHKQAIPPRTCAEHRMEMVRLAIQDTPSFEISDCEVKRKGISYSWDTLCELEKQYKGAAFFMILGQDSFEGIDTWHRASELKEKVHFLVARRGGDHPKALEGLRVSWVQMPLCPISASGIRQAIKKSGKLDDDLPPKVLQYIRTHALYRNG